MMGITQSANDILLNIHISLTGMMANGLLHQMKVVFYSLGARFGCGLIGDKMRMTHFILPYKNHPNFRIYISHL